MNDEKQIVFSTEVAPKDLGNPAAIAGEVKHLIDQGMSPEEACKQLGINLKRNAELRQAMRRLVAETGNIPMNVQKELVRNARLKVMMKNVHSDDQDAQKLALQAAKQIASDPDVGLNVPPAIVNLIDIKSLEEVFKYLDDDVIEVEAEEVLDGD